MHAHLLESEEKLTGTRLTLVPRRRSAPTSESAVLLLLLLYAAPLPAICWLDPPLAVAWGSCTLLGRPPPPAAVGSSRLEPCAVSGRAVLVLVRRQQFYLFCYNKNILRWLACMETLLDNDLHRKRLYTGCHTWTDWSPHALSSQIRWYKQRAFMIT